MIGEDRITIHPFPLKAMPLLGRIFGQVVVLKGNQGTLGWITRLKIWRGKFYLISTCLLPPVHFNCRCTLIPEDLEQIECPAE
jgi:hypothetical protein